MSFRVPTFPIKCNIYDFFSLPPAAPRLTSVCQLRVGRWVAPGAATDWATGGFLLGRKLLLPKRTDIRSLDWYGASDTVEVPVGSGRWYQVVVVDDVARGFTNEYRFAVIIPQRGAPLPPIPGPPLP
jgi:hypothetical protein